MKTVKVCTNAFLRQRLASSSGYAALLAAGLIGSSAPAAAQISASNNPQQPTPITVRLIEWDLPQQMDNIPGAMITDIQGDRDRLWFVTRTQQGDSPRVYRVDLRNDKKNRNTADWFSWELQPPASATVANGLKRIRTSKDGRSVFVHTTTSLVRIDTQAGTPLATTMTVAGFTPNAECRRTTWPHDQINDPDHPANPETGSDVSIDDYNNIFSSVATVV